VVMILPDRIAEDTGLNSMIMAQIAVAHSAFMVISVTLFSTAFWRLLLAFARKITFAGKPMPVVEEIRYLDRLLLMTPEIALEQCVKQIAFMTRQCHKNISAAFASFMARDVKDAERISKREDRIDGLQAEITDFLVELGRLELSTEQSRLIPRLIHCVNDAERIGDHAENLMELTQISVENKHVFTQEAQEDLKAYFDLVDRQFKAVILALEKGKSAAVAEALAIEKQLNEDCVTISRRHVCRLENGRCGVREGVVFLDVVANIEKIGDHLSNIAERVEIENES